MKAVAMINGRTGIIKIGNAITAKDIRDLTNYNYTIEDKPMKQIWKQKIDDIQEIIDGVELWDDERLIDLCRKKELLQRAFNTV